MAATSICICGESGSGKSTSLRNLDPKETFIIATIAKPLPFRGWKKNYTKLVIDKDENGNTKSITGNYYVSDKWDKIIKIMKLVSAKMPHIKNLVVDDLQYTMAFEFVDRASEKSYDKFNEMAQHLLSIFRTTFELRNDLTVVFLTHSENVGTEIDPKYTFKLEESALKQAWDVFAKVVKWARAPSGKKEEKSEDKVKEIENQIFFSLSYSLITDNSITSDAVQTNLNSVLAPFVTK